MTYRSAVDKTKHFLLELFFPSFCLGCRREGTYLCQDCQETLDISQHRYCLCNKKSLRLPPENPLGTCYRCKSKNLDGVYTALAYQEKALTRKIIYQFKYQPYIKDLSQTLAAVILSHLALAGVNTYQLWQDAILVPVPMNSKKMKRRGYNQAQELAKKLALATDRPILAKSLIKTKATQPQMKLSLALRQKNLAGAFAIKNPEHIRGKKIILVDDVYTTGATMEECAAVLRRAGATSVWGLAIAREG